MNDELLERLLALVEATPSDDNSAALVLADQLTALGDPRGELIVLDSLDRAGCLHRPEQLERLLLLAAEYTFPLRGPEPPSLRWRPPFRKNGSIVYYLSRDDKNEIRFEFDHTTIGFNIREGDALQAHPPADVDDCGEWVNRDTVYAGWLEFGIPCPRTPWTEETAAVCMPILADWYRDRVPECVLWLPVDAEDYAPAPRYDGGPARIARLPARFRQPRNIPHGRYALAGRDYHRWISTFRRLEAMLQR